MSTIAKREPFYLYSTLMETIYTTRRKTQIAMFYDNSQGKIGRQKLNNKLKFTTQVKEPWLDKGTEERHAQSAA